VKIEKDKEMNRMEKRLLNIKELSEYLGVKKHTLLLGSVRGGFLLSSAERLQSLTSKTLTNRLIGKVW